MSLGTDVFTGKISKSFAVETGFKGQLTLPDGDNIFLLNKYNGKTTDYLKENVGKIVVLMGDLHFPGMDAKTKVPILEVRGKVNGGGLVVKRGRLTKDAELAYTFNGKQLTRFTLAVNYGYGEKQETDFILCTIWGNDKEKNAAVSLAENGTKGRELLVKGRIQFGKDKEDKPFPTMTTTDFEFIGAAPNKTGAAPPPAKGENLPSGWEDVGTEIPIEEDEIPF